MAIVLGLIWVQEMSRYLKWGVGSLKGQIEEKRCVWVMVPQDLLHSGSTKGKYIEL